MGQKEAFPTPLDFLDHEEGIAEAAAPGEASHFADSCGKPPRTRDAGTAGVPRPAPLSNLKAGSAGVLGSWSGPISGLQGRAA